MKSHGPYHLNELFGLFEFHASILDLALNLKKTPKKHPSLQILIIPRWQLHYFKWCPINVSSYQTSGLPIMPNSNARKTINLGNNDNETLLYILQYTLLIYWNFIKSVTLTFPNDLDLLITLIILQAHVTTNIHIYASIVSMWKGSINSTWPNVNSNYKIFYQSLFLWHWIACIWS